MLRRNPVPGMPPLNLNANLHPPARAVVDRKEGTV
jgi:hypothetical protein